MFILLPILTGDFNLAKSSELYDYFKKKGNWTDAFEQDTTPTFHQAFLPIDRKAQRIDYIFTRGNIKADDGSRIFEDKVNGQYFSNHMGLMAHLRLPESE